MREGGGLITFFSPTSHLDCIISYVQTWMESLALSFFGLLYRVSVILHSYRPTPWLNRLTVDISSLDSLLLPSPTPTQALNNFMISEWLDPPRVKSGSAGKQYLSREDSTASAEDIRQAYFDNPLYVLYKFHSSMETKIVLWSSSPTELNYSFGNALWLE